METQIAWAAGLFDGEGTFYIARTASRNPNYQYTYVARLKLGMCHEAAVRKIQELLGGSVSIEHKPAINSNFKQYRWSLSGKSAVEAAEILLPYLIVKEDEARIFLEWKETMAEKRQVKMTPEIDAHRADVYARLRAIKSSKYTPI